MIRLLLSALVLSAVGRHAIADQSSRVEHVSGEVRVFYLERCGGCHGLQGVSAPREIPSLRGVAGRFLCTKAGREYVVRLPSIALAPLNDEVLAQLVNFVMFDMEARMQSDTPVTRPTRFVRCGSAP